MKQLSIDEHTVGFRDVGAGPAVLLLHSGGLGSRQWARLMGQLGRDYRLIAPDFLGTGSSSGVPRDAPFHFNQDVVLVRRLLDALDVPEVHVVGHSYGGLVGLTLARETPARVLSMALFEPVAFGVLYSAGEAVAIRNLEGENDDGRFFDDAVGGDEPWLERFIDWWQGPGRWASLEPASREAFLTVGRKVYQEVRSLTADRTPHEAYAGLTVPTLLMTASESPLAAQRLVTVLAETMPAASLRVFEDAGHMAPLTHGRAVNEAIVTHLSEAVGAE
ncbi:MAG: alpha/beta fold hydrolase [Sandaracinaceae bacterium]